MLIILFLVCCVWVCAVPVHSSFVFTFLFNEKRYASYVFNKKIMGFTNKSHIVDLANTLMVQLVSRTHQRSGLLSQPGFESQHKLLKTKIRGMSLLLVEFFFLLLI